MASKNVNKMFSLGFLPVMLSTGSIISSFYQAGYAVDVVMLLVGIGFVTALVILTRKKKSA
ncbi:hypothetical protein [Picrophilus oshimae]|uniref:Uncharacterized protein n=1 Tax=Picrophilus torridus (strain ATCC 700027 / DSM 9790 / JCM 10055 / NBRC 100828 / KAW 2/3) TaxID=1122961 RepID=A0A8G2FX06_PICTO|nr:hypothetical protein [Picrophilus oshimae]SMD31042.1 hypothetical protein SAMN02745355_0961 [Picrophilus oshimae DSM 9789]